jgi:hypothetical protein
MDGDSTRGEARPPQGWRALEELLEAKTDGAPPLEKAAAQLLESFELFRRGVRMMRMNLRREDPAAAETVIDARLRDWLGTHPGAPFGDGPGRPAPERLRRILEEAE